MLVFIGLVFLLVSFTERGQSQQSLVDLTVGWYLILELFWKAFDLKTFCMKFGLIYPYAVSFVSFIRSYQIKAKLYRGRISFKSLEKSQVDWFLCCSFWHRFGSFWVNWCHFPQLVVLSSALNNFYEISYPYFTYSSPPFIFGRKSWQDIFISTFCAYMGSEDVGCTLFRESFTISWYILFHSLDVSSPAVRNGLHLLLQSLSIGNT